MTSNASSLWTRACQQLQKQLSPDIYEHWIAVIQARDLDNNTLALGVSNDFYQTWLEEHYLVFIREALTAVSGQEMNVRFVVDAKHAPAHAPVSSPESRGDSRVRKSATKRRADVTLNPKYVFDEFVVGPSNDFAHATSLAVAQAPGRAYNPLFIYGGTALGKTHLMQAIGNHMYSTAKTSVCYLFCESLLNEYVESMLHKTQNQFRNKYRSVDVLLVDDVHFLTNKEGLQEEFFHMFNELYNARKQIVLTSDRPANDIAGLSQRLVTRFQWGQVAEISAPDFETRLAILRCKQKKFNVQLPEDILEFVAARVRSNIRNLEGALNRLTAYSGLCQKALSVDTLESLLKDILEGEQSRPVTIELIQRMVAGHFNLQLADMVSRHRSQRVVLPRQVAMFVCRSMTPSSLPEIGAAFGKTHATVLHACRQIQNRINSDHQFRNSIVKLTEKVERQPHNA